MAGASSIHSKSRIPTRLRLAASAAEGGFTASGTCVVSAGAMMLPMLRGKMQYPRSRKSTAFDARPSLSPAQWTELAKAKLKEAIESVLSGLVKE